MIRLFMIPLLMILSIGCSNYDTAQSPMALPQTKALNIVKQPERSIGIQSGILTSTLPMPGELLHEAIRLECEGFTIVEWKPSPRFRQLTSPSQDSIRVINDLCIRAFEQYPNFLWSKFNWTPENNEHNFNIKISMLPANMNIDGGNSRALNDFQFRLSSLKEDCCNWGLYLGKTNQLLLRNDPLISSGGKTSAYPNFSKTFVHELAHIMNDKFGYKAKYFTNDDVKDEALAVEFSVWMGYKFKTESSDDDLANKLR